MTQRDKLTAYAAALQAAHGADVEIKYPLRTSEAIALAQELDVAGAAQAEAITVSAAAFVAAAALPATDPEEQILAGAALAKAATEFWDAFEGQTVDGVTVIRRR